MYSHDGVRFDGEASSFNVKTRAGEITVLDHHHPLITILEACKAVVIKQNGDRAEFDIQSGFLEMDPNNTLTVLVSK
jgi:F0F1-type ATP synthase epsilon subunit